MTDDGAIAADPRAVLDAACRRLGLPPGEVEPIRLGENATYRLPRHGIVARVARPRPNALATATKELRVAAWLADNELPAARGAHGVDRPVEVAGRVVTFWEELPEHRHGSYPHVAAALRRLHALPIPTDLGLEPYDALARTAARIDAAITIPAGDRRWLRHRFEELRARYPAEVPAGLGHTVIHADPSIGNVVATSTSDAVLLDLENFSYGPPEWDLVTTATDFTTFGILDRPGYQQFCNAYGHDVTEWAGFPLLLEITELRNTCWMAQRASEHPEAQPEAEHRIASLQGRNGPRPWHWHPVM